MRFRRLPLTVAARCPATGQEKRAQGQSEGHNACLMKICVRDESESGPMLQQLREEEEHDVQPTVVARCCPATGQDREHKANLKAVNACLVKISVRGVSESGP